MQRFRDLLARIFSPKPAPAPTPMPMQITSAEVTEAINIERARFNLLDLVLDDRLNDVSMKWAAEMAHSQHLTHGQFAARLHEVYPNVNAGENVAAGQQTIEQVVKAWMSDPPHRANVLGHYNIIGVGFATASNGIIYWCTDFAYKT